MADGKRDTKAQPGAGADRQAELAPDDLDRVAGGFAGGLGEVVITLRKDSGGDAAGSSPMPRAITSPTAR